MTSPIDVTHAPVRRRGDRGKTGTFWRPQLAGQGGRGGVGTPGSGPIQIRVSGPLFTGQADTLIAQMIDEMLYRVAGQVLADWQLNMDRAFKNPTPYYETQVTVQPVAESYVVHDRGIVYGPWLEGTSERNRSTRFKGYGSMRRAADEVRNHKAQPILNAVAREYIDRINGT